MDCVTVGKGIRLLVPRELESSLLGASIYTKKDQGWTPRAKANGLLFDFSRVEYADFGAVVQVVLLIESALRAGIDVTLAMPFPERRIGELRWLKDNPRYARAIEWRVKRRERCKSFLSHLRLREAFDAPHIRELPGYFQVVDNFDPATTSRDATEGHLNDAGELTERELDVFQEHEPARYHYFLPLTWLSTTAQDPWLRIGAFLLGVLGQSERGIEGPDAKAIANVVLSELVENVGDHSETTTWALLGAWARPETSPPRPEHFLEGEQGYLEWFLQQPSPMVELVLGDSGIGIPASLRESYLKSHGIYTEALMHSTRFEAEIMNWAFGRWSSRRSLGVREGEGTRGLYRVDRVVTRYQGIITIRAENHLVGIDHGGPSHNEPLPPDKGKLARIPGTMLRLRLPACRVSYCPRAPGTRLPSDVHFRMVDMEELRPSGFSASALQRLHESLEEIPSGETSCVLARVQGSQVPHGLLHDAVLKALGQAARRRHPPALVLLDLPGGWNLIQNAVDDLNLVHEEQKRDVESVVDQDLSVWDPVLVVGARGEVAWAGVSTAMTYVLALLESNQALSHEDIKRLGFEKKAILELERQLRGDTALFSYGIDGNVSLRIRPGHIPRIIGRLIEANINSTAESDSNSSKLYLTPSLHLVRCWLSIDRILNATCGPRVAITALYMQLSSVLNLKPTEWPNVIVTDSANYLADSELLQDCVGIPARNRGIVSIEAAASTPARVRLFEDGSRVLVYTDIISTGESAQRCVRQALRDGAKVLAISCLIDARAEKADGISVWGIKIPIVALAKIDMLVDDGKPGEYINPVSLELEREYPQYSVPEYRIQEPVLDHLLEKNSALYFSHVGRPIGRHFTFYLGAPKLADEPEVRRAFLEAITDWLSRSRTRVQEGRVEGIDLCVPQSDNGSLAASKIAAHLQDELKDISRVRALYRRPAYGQWTFSDPDISFGGDVVIMDTGALTGTTIFQMIRLAAEHGAKRILVCIFLSQLPRSEERFLTMLDRLSIRVYATSGVSQLELLLNGADENLPQQSGESMVRYVEVRVEFIARYPIEAYAAADCPVCQQLFRLSNEMYPTGMLANFARSQQQDRLLVRSLESVLNDVPQDFDGRTIESKALLWMSWFRRKVVDAMTSTRERQSLYEKLSELRSNVPGKIGTQSQECLWLLQFLTVESQWLRKPPLYLWVIRHKIADIALAVALNVDVDECDRVNAVLVLRTSSKMLFADNFAEMFAGAKGQGKVLQRLLYDAFTYITRPYHQSTEVLAPITRNLGAVVKQCEDHTLLVTEIADTARRLYARAQAELAKAGTRAFGMARAWAALLTVLGEGYKLHHPASQNMHRIVPTEIEQSPIYRLLDEREREGTRTPIPLTPELDAWVKGLERGWTVCAEFLDHEVLPQLIHLKRALLGEDATRALGEYTVEQLVGFIDQSVRYQVPVAECEFSTLISTLSRSPANILNRQVWEEFDRGARWFWKSVLKPQGEGGDRECDLIRFLKSAPANLVEIFEEIYLEQKPTMTKHVLRGIEAHDQDWFIYCPRELLRDTFRELLDNVSKHVDNEVKVTNIQITIEPSDNLVTFRLENDNWASRTGHGVGIQRLAKRLASFDIKLAADPVPRQPQDLFGVSLSFEKME